MVYEARAESHSLEIAGAVRWFDLPATPGSRREVFGGVLAEHYVVQVWPEEPSATVNLTTGERVQRPGPVEPVTDSGVWTEVAEVTGLDGFARPARPLRRPGEGRGRIRG